ncbi:MAG: hypothetical protein J5502_09995 [Prevotella sp.]|nr:hypothetical protein [Prevotella sp.]
MKDKEQEKMRDLLTLAKDQETQKMIDMMAYNWEVCASRMEQIAKERQQGLFDDNGVEATAVFNRMERVGTLMTALKDRPQALLLKGFREQLNKMNADHRMDVEITSLISPNQSKTIIIETPTIWLRMKEMLEKKKPRTGKGDPIVRKMFKNRYLPNMEDEEAMGWMHSLSSTEPVDEETERAQLEAMDTMAYFGQTIGQVASGARQQIGMGLVIMHQMTLLFSELLDIRKMADEDVDALFEDAKKELLESDAWKSYWRGHINHLSLMKNTSLTEELTKDADEVEQQLLDLHGYLYNKWDESSEAFGKALKDSDMGDDEMLRLLFLLAKKAALELEGERPDNKLWIMRSKVKEYADKLYNLVDDKYDNIYDKVWEDIVQNAIIGAQLSDFRKGRHNDGFHMQCFCHIVGWMQREYSIFGDNAPTDLGKQLGDRYSWETFKDYIKKREIMLTAQSIKELDSILKKHTSK